MNYEYKTVTFGVVFATKENIQVKLQNVLDEYGKDGWRLHSFQIACSAGDIGICVFEREK